MLFLTLMMIRMLIVDDDAGVGAGAYVVFVDGADSGDADVPA